MGLNSERIIRIVNDDIMSEKLKYCNENKALLCKTLGALH